MCISTARFPPTTTIKDVTNCIIASLRYAHT